MAAYFCNPSLGDCGDCGRKIESSRLARTKKTDPHLKKKDRGERIICWKSNFSNTGGGRKLRRKKRPKWCLRDPKKTELRDVVSCGPTVKNQGIERCCQMRIRN
jgi:hypothetical protein